MIIDTLGLTDLGAGNERRIIQPGDSQVTIPPVVVATIEPLEPLFGVVPLSGTQQNQSFVSNLQNTRTNLAGISIGFVTLGPGYWKLRFVLSTSFNWVGTGITTFGVDLGYTYKTLAGRFWRRYAGVGSFVDPVEFDLLIDAALTIQQTFSITGVGQTSDANFSLVASRYL